MSKNPFGNMGNIMRQAQAMQDQMARLQEQAATKMAEGSAGGGMVTVKANGAMEIVSVTINPDVMKSGESELLQDMVVRRRARGVRARRLPRRRGDRAQHRLPVGPRLPPRALALRHGGVHVVLHLHRERPRRRHGPRRLAHRDTGSQVALPRRRRGHGRGKPGCPLPAPHEVGRERDPAAFGETCPRPISGGKGNRACRAGSRPPRPRGRGAPRGGACARPGAPARGGRGNRSRPAASPGGHGAPRGRPDSWEQYVQRGPAFSYLQVPQLPTDNGVRLFSQDPDTKIWVEGPTLPYWHLATNADGTVQFDDNGNIVGDALPFIEHFGMAAPTTAEDPREVQDILDSGLLDDTYKAIKGRDKNGNVTTSSADKGTMYYDPRDNEAARAVAKRQTKDDTSDDVQYWFDGKTRSPRREKALAQKVTEERERAARLAHTAGALQNQPYGKGGRAQQPYGSGTFGGATNIKAAAALVNASAFDTIAEQIGINLAGTSATRTRTPTPITGLSPLPSGYTLPSAPALNTYSGPTFIGNTGFTLPSVPTTPTIKTPVISAATGFNLSQTGPKITTPTITQPTLAERQAETAAKTQAGATKRPVAF